MVWSIIAVLLEATLAAMLTPPDGSAVQSAIRSLRSLGAMSASDSLTPLGRHLAAMPLDPRIAKALIYAAMLR